MLTELSIRNIAVIDQLNLDIKQGMSVLTGETGAGKSIIIDSINLILGARANKTLVRYGEKKATVQAVFDIGDDIADRLRELGIDAEDGQIIITREITDEGRSVCRINGMAVPASVLRELPLIDIHGQHDNQALLTPAKHVSFLDMYAANETQKTEYTVLYRECTEIKKKITALDMDEKERVSKIDLLQYQAGEIEQARLRQGEEEQLIEQRTVIANAERIVSSLEKAYYALYENTDENCAYDCASIAQSELSKISEFDAKLAEVSERIAEAVYTIEDCAHEIREYMDSVEFDESLLNAVEERLDLISKLKRKYGTDINEILAFGAEAKKQLESLTDSNETLNLLSEQLKEKKQQLKTAGEKLFQVRAQAGMELERKIEHILTQLDMPKVRFAVSVTHENTFYADGMDKVEFLFSANPGQPPRPLAQIASGGELSRVMLAIKSILADTDSVDTLIFDEIDTGVSGSAARKIGAELMKIAGKRQVICISHLPQIASCADHQYLIQKNMDTDQVTTNVQEVTGKKREEELARMIDGSHITDTALEHVKQMLSEAEKLRKI